MRIKRGILGEKAGSVFGTIEVVLSEDELRQAYEEYVLYYGDEINKKAQEEG